MDSRLNPLASQILSFSDFCKRTLLKRRQSLSIGRFALKSKSGFKSRMRQRAAPLGRSFFFESFRTFRFTMPCSETESLTKSTIVLNESSKNSRSPLRAEAFNLKPGDRFLAFFGTLFRTVRSAHGGVYIRENTRDRCR